MGKRGKSKKKIHVDGSAPREGFGHNPFAAALGGASALEAATAAPPKDEAKAPAKTPARAVVRCERKGRGGKTVTLITHLGLGSGELESWCATLRKKAGCGGSVEADAIALQGDQRERAVSLLKQMGVKRVTRG